MKKNIKLFIGILIGIIIGGAGVYAITTITADQVNYDSNTTVKAKIDDLYTSVDTFAHFAQYISVVNGDTQLDFNNLKRSGFSKFKVTNPWNNGASCTIKQVNTTTWAEENSPYALDTTYDIPDENRILLRATSGQCDYLLYFDK